MKHDLNITLSPSRISLPFKLAFLQQVPQGVQISHVGGVVEPHVVLLQRFVAELLLKPFLQVTAW